MFKEQEMQEGQVSDTSSQHLPDRSCGGVDAITNTSNNSPSDHLPNAVRGDLNNGSDCHLSWINARSG
jgi:hypothetical protein